MATSRGRVRSVVASGVVALSLACASTAPAAERPSSPGFLVWLLSLNAQRENGEPRKIDVNSATAEKLAGVPGLDRRQALRIIASRPYATLQDLARAGLSARFIKRLEGLLTTDSRSVQSAPRDGVAPATSTPTSGR